MSTRPALSRNDLETLKAYDRTRVIEALGTFDERGLSEAEFVERAAELLDPECAPKLATAMTGGTTDEILAAVLVACNHEGFIEQRALIPQTDRHAADDILANRFSFYDEPHQLPEDIDWDFNPGTAHWGHDLNRFSYLKTLTDAFLETGEGRYARKAVDLILDWIGKCDLGKAFVGTPYVFGSYLNNAIHCEVWSACIRRLLPSGLVKPLELLRILKSLHDQLSYLEIVTKGHSGNWPTIGCRSMLATLAAFPVLRDTDRFANYCIETFASQIDEQVLPDGVQDELTPHYHLCVVRNILVAVKAARDLGKNLAPKTIETLRKMVHYTQQVELPDGSGQVGFNDSDPAHAPEIRTMLERAGLQPDEFMSPEKALGSELFPFAGVCVMRQNPKDGDLYLAFDGGPFGRSHQHEDKLGFSLYAYGRTFIVDPGRHLYDNSEKSYRSFLTSTRAHSTILVDGAGQHSRAFRDTWIAKEPLPIQWTSTETETRAAARYDLGYGEDNSIAVTHHREIVFVNQRFWLVFDVVAGDGNHHIESRFQFAPCSLDLQGRRAHTEFDDSNVLLCVPSDAPYNDIHIEEGQNDPEGGWYSPRYGLIEPAPCLSISVEHDLPLTSATLFYPYQGTKVPEVGFDFDGSAATVKADDLDAVTVCLKANSLGQEKQ